MTAMGSATFGLSAKPCRHGPVTILLWMPAWAISEPPPDGRTLLGTVDQPTAGRYAGVPKGLETAEQVDLASFTR